MKKSKITGWKHIFSFSFMQTVKSRAYKATFIFMILSMLVSFPLLNVINGNKSAKSEKNNKIEKVYVYNYSQFTDIEFNNVNADKTLKHIKFESTTKEQEELEQLIDTEEKTSVILRITFEQESFKLQLVKTSSDKISKDDATELLDVILQDFNDSRNRILGITEEQLAIINAPIVLDTYVADEVGTEISESNKGKEKITDQEFAIVYGITFVVLMISVLSSSLIAGSIATDKTSKSLEFLLTSVKPLAIIIGRVIAMLSATLLQVGAMLIAGFLSNKIAIKLFDTEESVISEFISSDTLANFNIGNIALCAAIILLGMIFYGILAGLAGATANRVEDIGQAMMIYTIVNLVGFYIAMAASQVLAGAGNVSYVTFAVVFPLSAPFILPGVILIGETSILLIVGAIALLVIVTVLLFMFVAKIYETLLLYNGNKVGLKLLLGITRTTKKEGR